MLFGTTLSTNSFKSYKNTVKTDALTKISCNLLLNPILEASFAVVAHSGQYDDAKSHPAPKNLNISPILLIVIVSLVLKIVSLLWFSSENKSLVSILQRIKIGL